MNRLIVWFLQKFPAPDRRAIYRAGLDDLPRVHRRDFLLRLIAEECGYDVHIHKNPRRSHNSAVSGVDE
jgi:hypothetical protein